MGGERVGRVGAYPIDVGRGTAGCCRKMKRISVLLADDHAVFREGLRALLEAEADIEVVGEAKNGRRAVELTRKLRPAVVMMDIAMPLLNGLEATRIILNTLPLTKVLILSAHGDEAYVERATELGAAGYLLKQSSTDLLPNAVRDVQKGCRSLWPSSAKRRRDQQPRHKAVGGRAMRVWIRGQRPDVHPVQPEQGRARRLPPEDESKP